MPHDGDGPGGWQTATAKLKVADVGSIVPRTMSCVVTVGLPLRTRFHGRISPAFAAALSADVASVATERVMKLETEWITAAYCTKLVAAMNAIFSDAQHKDYGARVTGGAR